MTVSERDVIISNDKFDNHYFAYLTNMKFIIGKYRNVTLSRVSSAVSRTPNEPRARVVFFHARRAILLIHVAAPPGRTSVGRDSSIHLIRLQKTRATCFRNCGNENDKHTRARYNAQRYEAFRVAVHLFNLFNLFNYHPAAYPSAFEIEASKNCMCAFTGRYFFTRRDEVEIC